MKQHSIDDPDMPLDTLMSLWPETVAVFLRHKMLCVGCMISTFHTVVDACIEYDLDEWVFRAELHAAAGI
jgi:hybrid cluster-associated redox disulfide protein